MLQGVHRHIRISPYGLQAGELGDYLADSDIVLDGGNSSIGIESTIIDCTRESPLILRPGFITESMINGIRKLGSQKKTRMNRVSGNFEKHYAPSARILMDVNPQPGQAFFAMSQYLTPVGVHRISSPSSVEQFAKELYKSMREADTRGYMDLVIQIPRDTELTNAILDRVTKSAKGR